MPCQQYVPGGIALPEIPYNQSFGFVLRCMEHRHVRTWSRASSVEVTMLESDPTLQLFVFTAPVGRFAQPIIPNTSQQSIPFNPRVGASMTELPDGRIVIIGGARLKTDVTDVHSADNPNRAWLNKDSYAEILDTVEIFDPATGVFELVTLPGKVVADEVDPQTLFYRRAFHAAVYLESKNQIAVIGGLTQTTVGQPIQASASIELFDVANRQFLTDAAVGALGYPRVMPQANTLRYGDVELILVTGGTNDTADAQSAQSTFEVIEPIPQNHIKELGFMIGPRLATRRLR